MISNEKKVAIAVVLAMFLALMTAAMIIAVNRHREADFAATKAQINQVFDKAAERTQGQSEITVIWDDFSDKTYATSSPGPKLVWNEKPVLYIYLLSAQDGHVVNEIECHSTLNEHCSPYTTQSITWLNKDKVAQKQYLEGGLSIRLSTKQLKVEGGKILE